MVYFEVGLVNDYKLYRQLQKDRISREKQDLAKPRVVSNGSDFANIAKAPFGFPIDRKIEPQIVNLTHPWVSPYPRAASGSRPRPYWPY